MKIFFISSSVYILYLMKGPFRPTHDPNIDTFKIEYLLIAALLSSLLFNYEYSFSEVFPLIAV
jgi:ER lumen protein retaining receptor